MYESLSIYTPRRRNTSFEAIEEMENQFITTLAKEASINAIKDTLSRGIPVVTLINKSIVRIHPDGKTETISKLHPARVPVNPPKRKYYL
jgi:hypothetical protein